MKSKTKSRVTLEKGQTLDESVLWGWIQEYYSKGGVAVWSDGDIPFHITNTPILAQEWAQSVFTVLRDFARDDRLDADQPIEVFELGPGTGRHAYFLLTELKRLEPLTKVLHPQGFRFRLHLAELGIPGLESLGRHPNLEEAIEMGDLVLHQFNIDKDPRPTQFLPTKPSLPEQSGNPIFVVANYILDSLPHDVVRFRDKKAQVGLTNLKVSGLKPGENPTDLPDLGEKIELTFSFPLPDHKYPNKVWNKILERYKRLEEETHIPFPTSALRLAERARKWSKTAAVFLVADKSFTTVDQLCELEEPELVPHGGGFSFNANLHTFGLAAQTLGGLVHHTPSRDGTLDLSHVIFPSDEKGKKMPEFLELRHRLHRLELFHSVDRFRTKESVDALERAMPLRLCLDLLRLTGFDPQVFYELSDGILRGLEDEARKEKDREEDDDDDEGGELYEMEEELREALPQCLAMVFPLPDDVDVAFEVGRVAYRMESYELAFKAFHISLEQYGKDPRTYFNLGLTLYYRGKFNSALVQFESALDADPNYDEARRWVEKTRKRLDP